MRRNPRRSALVAALTAAAVAALAACSPVAALRGEDSTPAASGQENPYGLITPGQIRVASLGDARPYTFTDESGTFTGFDVELFRKVASRIGVDDVVFSGQDFSGLLAAVANGQFDAGAAAIGITEERAETVDFSDGYLAGYLTVLAPPEADVASKADVAGLRLGVVQGTLQEEYATKHLTDTELVRFPDNNTAVSAVNTGAIDAHFLDFEAAKSFADQHGLEMAVSFPSFDAPAGFAVAPGNDALREALDGALHELMESGEWAELYKEWFPGSPMPERYLPSDPKTRERVTEGVEVVSGS